MRARPTAAASVLLPLALLLTTACSGCGKKEEQPETVAAPKGQGAATQDIVATGVGNGLGLGSSLAPTSTVWDRVFVVGDQTALVVGRALDEAIALRTADKGRTWTLLRAKPGTWQSWGVAADGSVVLVGGERKKENVAPGGHAAVVSGKIWFATSDGSLGEPSPLFPDEADMKNVGVSSGVSSPAVLSSELASVLADRGRSPILLYGSPGGAKPPPPLDSLRGSFVSAPYGRPAQLLSVSGGAVEVRPWPKPGEQLDPASRIPGPRLGAAALQQLSSGPECEVGPWSFQRVTSGAKAALVGVSDSRSLSIALPGGTDLAFGCHPEAVVVEVFDAKKKEPQLIRCDLTGKCAEPKSNPFAIWPEEHERKLLVAATKQGVVATMNAKTGTRWGAYLATSMDQGATFELARVIGEGQTERGFFDIGALIAFPDRVIILMSADVTGTRRRGWYVLSSDDDGRSWGPP